MINGRSSILSRIDALEMRLRARDVGARKRDARVRPLDLEAWVAKYLPHYVTDESAPAHRRMMRRLDSLHLQENRGGKIALVGSRGTAKSFYLSQLYPLVCALEGIEPYTIVASETTPNAAQLIAPIKSEVEENDLIRRDYPDAVKTSGTWNSESLEFGNGCRIDAAGVGKAIRGRRHKADRPSLIVIDDPESDEAIRSDAIRQSTREWMLRTVMKGGAPNLNVIVAENAIHRECLAFHLGSLPEWELNKWPSIMSWPKRMDLWAEWEKLYTSLAPGKAAEAQKFYEKHRREMHDGAELLWPAREDLLKLMKMRAEGHASFEAEKQCNPVSPTDCEWPSVLFDQEFMWVDELPTSGIIKAIGLDPSKGRDAKRGDYSAIIRMVRGKDKYLYVQADLQRRDSGKIARDFAEQAYYFKPDVAVLEANMNQDLLGEPIREECSNLGYAMPLTTIEHSAPKQVRIRRLSPWLHGYKFRFVRTPGTQLLVNQLRDFPVGDHDDGPDALEMTLGAMINAYNGAAAGSFQLDVQGDL
jgi:predicted phage terminase large subunit-like protein